MVRLADSGLRLQVSFILGLPGETADDMAQTLALMERLQRAPNVIVPGTVPFLPFPGTALHDAAVSSGWSPPQKFEDWGSITEEDPSGWLGPEVGGIAQQASFISSAIDTAINPRASTLAECLRKLYCHVARMRARNGWIRCVPEHSLLRTGLLSFLTSKGKSP